MQLHGQVYMLQDLKIFSSVISTCFLLFIRTSVHVGQDNCTAAIQLIF